MELRFHEKGISVWCVSYPQKMAPNAVQRIPNDLNIVRNGVHEVRNDLNIVGNESVQFTVLNQNSYYSQTCLPAGRFVSIRYPYLPLTKKIQPVTK